MQLTTPPSDNPSSTFPPKSRIGRFTLTQELDKGSNGAIYLGHDPVIDRPVAIKILASGVGAANKKQRELQFINEARAAGRLSHPNIVTIYDASTEAGITFIAMEFLQGQDLRNELLTGKQFTPLDVALIASKVASALAYAHEHGVIHRDIKPANIFILPGLTPKVVDFGIARSPKRVLDPSSEQEQTLFNNNLLGTPNYMSPEQAMGKPVTAATDIYSLGTVMYEMLTGQKPFQSQSVDKLLQLIAHKEPRPPHEINPAVPLPLSRIVMTAMRKQPEHRYPTAQRMERVLQKFLSKERRQRTAQDGDTVLMKPTGIASRTYTHENKRLFWLSFIAIFVALFVIFMPWIKSIVFK